jgi:hypothetical protein
VNSCMPARRQSGVIRSLRWTSRRPAAHASRLRLIRRSAASDVPTFGRGFCRGRCVVRSARRSERPGRLRGIYPHDCETSRVHFTRGFVGVAIASAFALAGADGSAQQEACVLLVAPPDLPSDWRGAVAELKARLAETQFPGCSTMTLALSVSKRHASIVATTRDGRRAERTVGSSDALVPTALGLTASIPTETLEAGPPRALAQSPASGQAAAGAPTPPKSPEIVAPTSVERPISATRPSPGLWMGLSAGLRLTGPTTATVLDVEARADLEFDRWLVLGTIRSGIVSCIGEQGLDCDAYNDVGAGVGLGRRFSVPGADIDLAFEPSVMAMHIEFDVASNEALAVQGTQTALVLDGLARLNVPLGPRWKLTLTADGGIAPALLLKPAHLELPADAGQRPPTFPGWMGGMRLGACGAVL